MATSEPTELAIRNPQFYELTTLLYEKEQYDEVEIRIRLVNSEVFPFGT